VNLSAADCEAVIVEARPHCDPIRTKVTACKAWSVPRRTRTAEILAALGLPDKDAQVVRYGPGGEYVWHTDGPSRTETIVVQLSDPDAYEGGDLEIRGESGVVRADRGRGSVTRFDSRAEHRAAPVVSGERWALVAWS
jgi:predicted 2-oxoglutarate/Fe(II)-dependent dioxygenase YbiX